VAAAVLPRAAIDPSGTVDGLIGQDLLADRLFTLDYVAQRLECGERPDPPGARRLPLSIEGGRALVTVPVPGGVVRLVPDSGADRLVLFGPAAGPVVTPIDMVGLRSVSGVRTARRVLVHGIGVSTDPMEGLLLDQPDAMTALADGLLPLHPFARVTFDGPGGALVIEERR